MKRVALIIPTFNEGAIIERNLRTCLSHFEESLKEYDWQLIVADNGSTDRTSELVKTVMRDAPELNGFHTDAAGRGGALKRAITDYPAEIYCYFDADLATDLRHVREALDTIAVQGYKIAIGSRLSDSSDTTRSFKRSVVSKTFNSLIHLILGGHLSDYQCGFKAMDASTAHGLGLMIEDNHWGWDTEMLIRAERQGLRIKEVPVAWEESSNEERESKVHVVHTSFYFLNHMLKLRKRLNADQ